MCALHSQLCSSPLPAHGLQFSVKCQGCIIDATDNQKANWCPP